MGHYPEPFVLDSLWLYKIHLASAVAMQNMVSQPLATKLKKAMTERDDMRIK